MEVVTGSDVSSTLLASLFGYLENGSQKNAMKQALVSGGTSILARLAANSGMVSAMSVDQKNQVVVAILSGIAGYINKQDIPKKMLHGVMIDVTSQELVRLFGGTDSSWLNISGSIPVMGPSNGSVNSTTTNGNHTNSTNTTYATR